ncbi:hypothetical protein VNI00_019190, partial [Paramarasmius palmivorus]
MQQFIRLTKHNSSGSPDVGYFMLILFCKGGEEHLPVPMKRQNYAIQVQHNNSIEILGYDVNQLKVWMGPPPAGPPPQRSRLLLILRQQAVYPDGARRLRRNPPSMGKTGYDGFPMARGTTPSNIFFQYAVEFDFVSSKMHNDYTAVKGDRINIKIVQLCSPLVSQHTSYIVDKMYLLPIYHEWTLSDVKKRPLIAGFLRLPFQAFLA